MRGRKAEEEVEEKEEGEEEEEEKKREEKDEDAEDDDDELEEPVLPKRFVDVLWVMCRQCPSAVWHLAVVC